MVADLGSKAEVMFAAVVWEADYRQVLQPEVLSASISQHRFEFVERVVLINNVNDKQSAAALAQQAVSLGLVDRYLWVEDIEDRACVAFGVNRRLFGRFWFWANGHLAALALPVLEDHGDWFVLVADLNSPLLSPCDWITPSLQNLACDGTAMCASPAWNAVGHVNDTVFEEAETFIADGVLVPGYADVNILVKPATIVTGSVSLGDIRWWSSPISARYPGPGFLLLDARIDAWMRATGHRRFVYTDARFDPRPTPDGNGRYAPRNLVERIAHYRDKVLLRLCSSRPWKSRRLALRPFPSPKPPHEIAPTRLEVDPNLD